MVRDRRDVFTSDLLAWKPPEPVKAFEPAEIRAASLRGMLAKLVSAVLKDADADRETIAARMSAYLGEEVSKNMLDAYASEARGEHVIPIVRLMALADATGDAQRIFQALTTLFRMSVIDDHWLPAIEDSMIDEKINELTQRRQAARRKWKGIER